MKAKWDDAIDAERLDLNRIVIDAGKSYEFKGTIMDDWTKLPDTVIEIGGGAFYNCTNLALTELSDNIKSIGTSAFAGCKNLNLKKLPSNIWYTSIGTLAIPSSVGTVFEKVFNGWTNKQSIKVFWSYKSSYPYDDPTKPEWNEGLNRGWKDKWCWTGCKATVIDKNNKILWQNGIKLDPPESL